MFKRNAKTPKEFLENLKSIGSNDLSELEKISTVAYKYGNISIRKKGDRKSYYTIHADGSVEKYTYVGIEEITKCNYVDINDMDQSVEYEYCNENKCFMSGYINIIDSKDTGLFALSKIALEKDAIVADIKYHIGHRRFTSDTNKKGISLLTNKFTFNDYDTLLTVDCYPMKHFINENNIRSKYGLRSYFFDKDKDIKKCFYVIIRDDISTIDDFAIMEAKCNCSINKLINVFKDNGYKVEWEQKYFSIKDPISI